MIENLISGWLYWVSSLRRDELFVILGGLLFMDAPRYALGILGCCIWDWMKSLGQIGGSSEEERFTYCPSVTAILVGHNEADTIGSTLESIWGSYPRLEIIVVDDGSQDGMFDVSREFAAKHDGVRVFGRERRSGKASALNTALHYAKGEIIVPVDADSDLGPSAIWEIVQPLQDKGVGAVSGAVLARNPFVNLLTRLEAYEYIQAILLGRIVSSRVGTLGIVSGAFGAFRREEIVRLKGWDVGHGEDSDLTLRLRKSGLHIAFAPYAQCFTNVPIKWTKLFKQRRRWNRGIIRNKTRKHIDMAFFWSPNFRWTNLLHLLDAWFFRVFCLFAIWGSVFRTIHHPPNFLVQILVTLYALYVGLQLIQVLPVMYYSMDRKRDAKILPVLFLSPLYQTFLRCARTCSILEEIFLRYSFRGNFYPKHVRDATWHW